LNSLCRIRSPAYLNSIASRVWYQLNIRNILNFILRARFNFMFQYGFIQIVDTIGTPNTPGSLSSPQFNIKSFGHSRISGALLASYFISYMQLKATLQKSISVRVRNILLGLKQPSSLIRSSLKNTPDTSSKERSPGHPPKVKGNQVSRGSVSSPHSIVRSAGHSMLSSPSLSATQSMN